MPKHKEEQPKNKNKNQQSYFRYTSIGYEMLGAIIAGLLLGLLLDEYTATEKRIWTAILVPFFTIVAILRAVVQLLRDQKREENES